MGVGGCPVGAGARGLEREVAEEAVLGEGVSDTDVAHRAGCGGDGDQSLMMLLFLFNTRNILHCRVGIGWSLWFVGRDPGQLRSEMRS